ncbi:MAG: HAD family hydrolase [Haloquadratum sp.]|nr:HAD family hydrolase [Haloferacaceae archaeon]MDR9444834.1 HAD family hydrolase [Haloquadratum sp.]
MVGVSRYDAVVFDLDDTLCRRMTDPSSGYAAAFETLEVDPFGSPDALWAELDGDPDPEDHIGYLGVGFARLAAQHDRRDVDPVALAEAFYAGIDHGAVEYTEGAPDALTLAERHGPVGLITNGPSHRQVAKVQTLGLEDRLDSIVYAGDLPRRKPHVDPFETATAALGVDPGRTLYVGNSLRYDVAGAHNAGLASAWYHPEAADPDPYSPDHILGHLRDLAGILG